MKIKWDVLRENSIKPDDFDTCAVFNSNHPVIQSVSGSSLSSQLLSTRHLGPVFEIHPHILLCTQANIILPKSSSFSGQLHYDFLLRVCPVCARGNIVQKAITF